MATQEFTLREARELYAERVKAETGVCPCCMRKVDVPNAYPLSSRHVGILDRVARINARGFEWARVQRSKRIADKDLARTVQDDDSYALRLLLWGLLISKGHRSGEYKISQAGLNFLAGTLAVPSIVYAIGKKVIRMAPTKLFVDEVRRVKIDKEFYDNYALSVVQLQMNMAGEK